MQKKRASVRFIERCYKLYEQKMYQVAYCILRDEGMAEDAVQEAFLKLMKSNIDFKDVGSVECRQYIIKTIKHASIDIYNKMRKEQKVMFFSDCNDDFEQTGKEDLDDQREEIIQMIEKLPEKYYEVLNCMIIKELSVGETAKEMEITEANVRKRFERAKLLLKTLTKGNDGNEKFRAI